MYSGCYKNLIYHLNSPSYENGGENGWRAWHLGCVLEAHEGKYHDLVDFFCRYRLQPNERSVIVVSTLTTGAVYRFYLVSLPDNLFSKPPGSESRV